MFRRKWCLPTLDPSAQPFKHRDDHVIVANSQCTVGKHLQRHMAIADMPSEARRLGTILPAKINDGFFRRTHPNESTPLKPQAVAVAHDRRLG